MCLPEVFSQYCYSLREKDNSPSIGWLPWLGFMLVRLVAFVLGSAFDTRQSSDISHKIGYFTMIYDRLEDHYLFFGSM